MIPPFLIKPLTYLGIAVALLATGYIKGCSDEKETRVKLEAKWEAAEKAELKRQADEKALRDRITKAKDDFYESSIAGLNADLKRLRGQPRRGFTPTAPEGSRRPDLACYPRAEFAAEIRAYLEVAQRSRDEIVELLGEGGAAALGLDTVRSWWQEQLRVNGQ
jgi:hypothetical protein